MKVLLLGIGNPLRRDDGVGVFVVRQFISRLGCEVMETHQLLPEHAEALARGGRVVFVDAAVNREVPRLDRLRASPIQPALGHACDPAWLLTLCVSLFGAEPEAWLLTIPAHDLGFGEGLSEATRGAADLAGRMLADGLSGQTT